MRKSPLGPHHTLFLRKKKKIKKSFISSRGRRRGELQFVVRIPSVRPSLAGFPLRSYKEKENTHTKLHTSQLQLVTDRTLDPTLSLSLLLQTDAIS